MTDGRAELDRLLHRACGELAAHGVGEGDVVATTGANDRSTFALAWAAAVAGVVEVPLPATAPSHEVEHLLAASGATRLLGAGASLPPAIARVAATRSVAAAALSLDARGPTATPPAVAPRTRAMAFTSGTTGRRKGVVVGVHDASWGRTVLEDEAAAFEHRHGDRHLVVSPLYHSGPFRHALVTAARGGDVAVLARFDVERWLHVLRTWRPSSLFCVPTHLHRLLAHPDLRRDDLASLTLLVHAGAPCPVPLKHRLLELAPAGSVWEFYGSTEGQFSVCPPDLWRSAPGTVGVARPGRELSVRDDAGRPLPVGEVGTVWTTAPEHARWSYLDAPGATAAAWSDDRFTVGDLGHLDEAGRLTLVGRRGDLVITGGVNVYPAEVERVLLDRDDVGEAVVFGVADDEWGQALVAAVTPAVGGATPDGDAVRRELRELLPAARVPREVLVVAELPRTATGKIARRALPTLLEGAGMTAVVTSGPDGGWTA